MKKKILVFILVAVVMAVSSCSPVPAVPTAQTAEQAAPSAALTAEPDSPSISATIGSTQNDDMVISIFAGGGGEVGAYIDRFIELHPDFKYTINPVFPTADSNKIIHPIEELDKMLTEGSAPDIYIPWASFAAKYTQGGMSDYAMPYKDLGIDVESEIAKADIAQYIVDIGTRPGDNAVVGLLHRSTAGAFIYRRSIAKKTWGTDKPGVIASKIGPGWDKFLMAAADLKKKGFRIVSGGGDIWPAVENSAEKGWILDGKLYIDPKREAYLDYYKEFVDKGYTNDNSVWSEGWRKDMSGEGENPVFGFFVTAWMVNDVIMRNCGGGRASEKGTWGDWAVCEPPAGFFLDVKFNWMLANKRLENYPDKKTAVAEFINWMMLDCTEEGLQYYMANGTLYDMGVTNDAVASGKVMAESNGKLDFLGGQNMFDVFIPANKAVNGRIITEYDSTIGTAWRIQTEKYAHGECTRSEAIAAFKQEVKEKLGIDAW